MIFKRTLLAVAVCAVSLPAWSDCMLPPPPSKIPDGNSASQQEMVTAMQTLKEYNGDVDSYTKCLEFETRQKRMSQSEEDRLRNSAIDALQKVAAKFNEQVRTFKAKSG
jgi:hypothetical protein